MISTVFPELARLHREAVVAVNAASNGAGTLEILTGIALVRHEVSQLLCEFITADTVGRRAGVYTKVHALTGPAIATLVALRDECDRELAHREIA